VNPDAPRLRAGCHFLRSIDGDGTMSLMWRRLLVIIVILHTGHAPVPVPDLDGEWQGVAVGGLTDPAAWGFVLLGVRANDDIDRGPVRHESPCDTSDPTGQPFGDIAVSGSASSMHEAVVIRRGCGPSGAAVAVMRAVQGSMPRSVALCRGDCAGTAWSSPGAARASLCVWHI